jgi:hypothetical protein
MKVEEPVFVYVKCLFGVITHRDSTLASYSFVLML